MADINRQYNNAHQWLDTQRAHRKLPPCNEFGRVVCWIMERSFGGLYNCLGHQNCFSSDWSDNRGRGCIEVVLGHGPAGRLSTFDFDNLTRLVIICHEAAVRCEIHRVSLGTATLYFHDRDKRDGRTFDRHPSIEEAVGWVRRNLPSIRNNPLSFEELQGQVHEWQLQVFGRGDDQSHVRSQKKVAEEWGEFNEEPSGEEAADVIIALFGWANRKGVNLANCLRVKWDVVRNRKDQVQRDANRGIRRESA